MKKSFGDLGELETLVMEQLWAEAPATARDVHGRLNGAADRQRAYTTIMTTLDRLHQKGILVRGLVGNAWMYEPKLRRAEYERVARLPAVYRHLPRPVRSATSEFGLNP